MRESTLEYEIGYRDGLRFIFTRPSGTELRTLYKMLQTELNKTNEFIRELEMEES